ncbi:MAG TPA: helix-turn-helix domain-containing protein [Myxococcales bacterium]|nr:helix-turn-helix domain-containing protein [Myxococcales bacterium]
MDANAHAALAPPSSLWTHLVSLFRRAGEVAIATGQPPALSTPQLAAVPDAALGGDFTVEEIERAHILRVLARAPTRKQAAVILGLDASTLWRKRKAYGM